MFDHHRVERDRSPFESAPLRTRRIEVTRRDPPDLIDMAVEKSMITTGGAQA
ncbi:MAG: hypothetical protein M3022_15015 [Actinomycetota bacterium]|nr:hypothetical protein [Actinomycetota bacterium]